MIQTKEELERYLLADREAEDIHDTRPRILGGGYKKKLWLFKIFLRKSEYYLNLRTSGKARILQKVLGKFYSVRKNRLAGQLGFSIPENTFGPGLRIPHYGTIVVNTKARIGAYCTIQAGVTIGQKGNDEKNPIIGDYCSIGTGAKIIGPITLGNHVTVGANAAVVKDVPDYAIVAGVPCIIIGWNDRDEFHAN